MKLHNHMTQGSDAWHQLRLGKVTGSMVYNIMKSGRGGKPSQMRESYMIQLIAERLTGKPTEFFETASMRWGTETEPEARAQYEWETDSEVKEVAFYELSEFVGYSPDGVIGDDGLLEIKCPNTTTQLKRFYGIEGVPDEYYAQMQFGMMVTGRKWCDFVNYDPRLAGTKAGLLIQRVERDEEYILKMEHAIEQFINDMLARIQLAEKDNS